MPQAFLSCFIRYHYDKKTDNDLGYCYNQRQMILEAVGLLRFLNVFEALMLNCYQSANIIDLVQFASNDVAQLLKKSTSFHDARLKSCTSYWNCHKNRRFQLDDPQNTSIRSFEVNAADFIVKNCLVRNSELQYCSYYRNNYVPFVKKYLQ